MLIEFFSLFQFMIRSEVLKLYRDILRSVRKIPDEYYREEMARWVRRDFKNNKHLTDEVSRACALKSI